MTRRLALFGGTFDPIHVGHLAIAQAAVRAAELDEVVFVPAKRNPLKESDPAVGAEDRYEMVRRAIFASPRFRASRVELDRSGPSYTIDTLRAFAAADIELFFVLGADALRDVPRWHDVPAVLSLVTLLVAKRPGAPEPEPVPGLPQARIRLLDSPLVDLSSRELRAFARSGGSLRYLVPDAAWRYAIERRLYGQVEDR